jgi:hypothetical protein
VTPPHNDIAADFRSQTDLKDIAGKIDATPSRKFGTEQFPCVIFMPSEVGLNAEAGGRWS